MAESERLHNIETVTESKMFARKMHRLVKKMQDKDKSGGESGISLEPLELITEMARKRGENLAFPQEVETEAQWSTLLKKEGLLVVDVFSGWSGPCSSMFTILRKLKLDTNDERLVIAAANADNISQLAPFRNQSEPCYLFMGGGKPVKVLRGSNAPKLVKAIKAELQHELDCIEGKEKRTLISIKFEASRREKAVTEAVQLDELMAIEEDEKKARLLEESMRPPTTSPTNDKEGEGENEEFTAEKEKSPEITFGEEPKESEEDENENETENQIDPEELARIEAEEAARVERRKLMEESNVRLMEALRLYAVIAIQSYLLETGAVTEIKDHLSEDFILIKERYINLNEEGVRQLFTIPAEIPDPNPPSVIETHSDDEDHLTDVPTDCEAAELDLDNKNAPPTSQVPSPLPPDAGESRQDPKEGASEAEAGEEGNEYDEDGDKEKKENESQKIRMLPVVVPEVIIGDTLILLLECTKVKPLENREKRDDEDHEEEEAEEGNEEKVEERGEIEEDRDADYYITEKTGPEEFEEAKENRPDSLHGKYGKEEYVAGVWCPRTYEDKRFVMLKYFPQFVTDMLMPATPEPPKYHIYLFSALFAAEISEHSEVTRI